MERFVIKKARPTGRIYNKPTPYPKKLSVNGSNSLINFPPPLALNPMGIVKQCQQLLDLLKAYSEYELMAFSKLFLKKALAHHEYSWEENVNQLTLWIDPESAHMFRKKICIL